jgi:hypothetical protein
MQLTCGALWLLLEQRLPRAAATLLVAVAVSGIDFEWISGDMFCKTYAQGNVCTSQANGRHLLPLNAVQGNQVKSQLAVQYCSTQEAVHLWHQGGWCHGGGAGDVEIMLKEHVSSTNTNKLDSNTRGMCCAEDCISRVIMIPKTNIPFFSETTLLAEPSAA